MSTDSPILSPLMKNLILFSVGINHSLVNSQTLKLVAWEVSGDENKQYAIKSKLLSSWLQVGDDELWQPRTAAEDSGLASGNLNNLIHFKPL